MLFQFKIQLKGVSKPPVWRRILIPATFDFERFHFVIQAAFGWENYHLYLFSTSGYGSESYIGVPNDEWFEEDLLDSREVKLSEVFYHEKQKYTYIYDLGDDWVHQIVLEKLIDENRIRAELVAGRGACPPEDCGGAIGYNRMLDIMEDPDHPEYDDVCDWLELEEDEFWDADGFILEEMKQGVSEV